MLCLPEEMEVDHVSMGLLATQGSEMIGNAFSVASTSNVKHVPRIPYFQNTLDGKRTKVIDKIAKMVKPVKHKRGCYNRKSSWTSSRVTSSTEDGYEWRKYGQKVIINAKHKRNYYRCINKFDQGCQATKQVQKIEEDQTKYKIIYHQHHTCKNFLGPHQIILDHFDDLSDTSILLSFESNEIIEKKQVDPNFAFKKGEEHKDGFYFPKLRHNESFLFDDYPSVDLATLLEPVSQIPSGFGHENMFQRVYSPLHEIDHILEPIAFKEIPFDYSLCYPKFSDTSYF